MHLGMYACVSEILVTWSFAIAGLLLCTATHAREVDPEHVGHGARALEGLLEERVRVQDAVGGLPSVEAARELIQVLRCAAAFVVMPGRGVQQLGADVTAHVGKVVHLDHAALRHVQAVAVLQLARGVDQAWVGAGQAEGHVRRDAIEHRHAVLVVRRHHLLRRPLEEVAHVARDALIVLRQCQLLDGAQLRRQVALVCVQRHEVVAAARGAGLAPELALC